MKAADAGVRVVTDQKRVTLSDAVRDFVQAARDRNALEAAEICKRTGTNAETYVGC